MKTREEIFEKYIIEKKLRFEENNNERRYHKPFPNKYRIYESMNIKGL